MDPMGYIKNLMFGVRIAIHFRHEYLRFWDEDDEYEIA